MKQVFAVDFDNVLRSNKNRIIVKGREMINKIMETNLPMTYEPNPFKNFVFHCHADTTKAEQELGFKADIILEQGIKKLI